MKFLSSKVFFLTLFFLALSVGTQAQGDCGFAGTEELWVTETSTNSIEVAWVEVPGVSSYRVEAVDVLTNTLVATGIAYAPNTVYEVQGLQPDREYEITVISLCDDGSAGGSNNIRARTTIIVVDIVMSLDCAPNGNNPNPQTGSNISYGASLAPINIPFGITNVLVLEGSVNAINQDFQLVFENQMSTSKNELKAGLSSAYAQFFRISAMSSGLGMIEYHHNNAWHEMATFKPFYGNNGEYLSITWKKSVILDVFSCNTVSFRRNRMRSNSNTNENRHEEAATRTTSFLQLSPNPTHGSLNINVPTATPLEIYDSQGRIWYHTDVSINKQLQIDATQWPAGLYFIRTQQHGQVVVDRFVKVE